MQFLIHTARWELALLVAALAVVIVWKVLSTADLSDLLRAADGSISPARIQMLMLTILTAMQYLLAAMHDPSHLPMLPQNLLTVLGGSHFVFLGAKAWTTFIPPRK